MEELDTTRSERDKSPQVVVIKKDPNEVHGQSGLYMFIFYSVSLLVLGSMIFHYLSLNGLFADALLGEKEVPTQLIMDINNAIPYGNLVLSLIIYCLGTFGFEGTRSVIMSFDLSKISEKAKNMPKYKRNRLVQMLITFIILTIIAMIFQMNCINHGITKADFQLSYLTTGIGTFMALLAYSDFAPKLSKQISSFVTDIGSNSKTNKERRKSDNGDEEEKFEVNKN
jgi:succinate dehydrogenase/fumarate reductase cytochrome b subunit